MGEHYAALVQSAAAQPDASLSTLPILGDQQRDTQIRLWSQTKADFPRDRCLHELVDEQVLAHPDVVAVEARDGQLTYRDLNARANGLACLLQRMGMGRDDVVALCMGQGLEMPVAVLGIMKAGAACLPLDPIPPPDRLAYMLDNARARLVLTEARLRNQLPATETAVLSIDEITCGEVGGAVPEHRADPESLTYVLYTSGSTGRPSASPSTTPASTSSTNTAGRCRPPRPANSTLVASVSRADI